MGTSTTTTKLCKKHANQLKIKQTSKYYLIQWEKYQQNSFLFSSPFWFWLFFSFFSRSENVLVFSALFCLLTKPLFLLSFVGNFCFTQRLRFIEFQNVYRIKFLKTKKIHLNSIKIRNFLSEQIFHRKICNQFDFYVFIKMIHILMYRDFTLSSWANCIQNVWQNTPLMTTHNNWIILRPKKWT